MNYCRITRWGFESVHVLNEKKLTIKTLLLLDGESTSLQFHKSRDEFWFAISPVRVVKGEEEILLKKDGMICIPRGKKHRLAGVDMSWIVEVSYGDFSEDDIVRLEDKYGRV